MSEKTSAKYRCGYCGKEWGQNEKSCSNCGSTRRVTPLFAEGKITLRTGVKWKLRDQSGKVDRVFKSVSKLSDNGKEAREYYDVDMKGNHYSHIVNEQDENGNWVERHTEDESLTEHNKKNQSKKKA